MGERHLSQFLFFALQLAAAGDPNEVVFALDALRHLEHRGAVGSDAGTGDGAGIAPRVAEQALARLAGIVFVIAIVLPATRNDRLVAYDAHGKVLWRRVSANHFGAVQFSDCSLAGVAPSPTVKVKRSSASAT